MFIDNAHPSLAHHMVMNYLRTYKDIKEKGMILEQRLIKDGVVKIYKDSNQDRSQSNDKSCYWNNNKHIVMDGVTNTRHVNIIGPTPNKSNTSYQQNYQQAPNYQKNLQQGYQGQNPRPNFEGSNNQANTINVVARQKPKFQLARRVYIPIVEPLDVIFVKLAKENLIKFPPTRKIDPNQSKASWFMDNEYCKFHHVKGHTTLRCMKLNNYVQELIDRKEIIVGAQTSPNTGL